ncbi:hypothetical protein SAMN05216436_103243 [bacterium A37T11]|nr:hypothetical protein SAMN05216436_103243 [bacterium A37T11]
MKLKQVLRKKIKRPNKPPRKQDDKLIKSAMEEFFSWFLRFMYPDADDIFDFSRGITILIIQI